VDISASPRPSPRTQRTHSRPPITAATAALAALRYLGRAIVALPAWMKLALCLALIGLMGLVGGTIAQNQGRVVPGVVVLGVPVGGLTHDAAAAAVLAQVDSYETQRVTINYGEYSWQPSLRELGIAVDVETAVARANAVGRGRDTIGGILRVLQFDRSPAMVEPPLIVDSGALATYCASLMEELEIAPVEARLQVSGETVLVTSDAAGYIVNVPQLRRELVRELRGFTLPTIDLDVTLAPATLRSDDLQYGLSQIATALAEPLVLYTADEQWTIPASELARHVRLDDSDGPTAVVIDDDAIRSIVDRIGDDIDQEARGATVSEAGPYLRLLAPREGRTVDREQLEFRIHQAITLGTHDVEIPVEISAADGDLANLNTDYGVTDELATGSSDFTGSSDGRIANIRRAAELVDGSLVPAGGEFSFNEAIGTISGENGFAAAGLPEAGIAGYDIGGGICQLSTSLFRASLLAGLPITEWWSHPYRNSGYERGGWAPGFDAMVQPGQLDFRFTNDTDGWILIRATFTGPSELTVTLLGTDPGFAVELSDPVYDAIVPSDGVAIEEIDYSTDGDVYELWQPARDGVTIYVHRAVWAADGTLLIDEDYVSTYWPQGPVYRVGDDAASAGTIGDQ
jgi:vancomycin resistance protein YoaR